MDVGYDQTVTYNSVDNSYTIMNNSATGNNIIWQDTVPTYVTTTGTSYPLYSHIDKNVDLDDYNNNKSVTDGRITSLEVENYNLKQQLEELKSTIKLIGDSLVEYADEHERKKKCTKKKENQKVMENLETLK